MSNDRWGSRWDGGFESDAWDDGFDGFAEEVQPGETTVALTEYQGRPLDFAVDVLGERRETYEWSDNPGYGAHQWDGDIDPFAQAFDAVGRFENVGIPGGIGLGKTRWLACLVLYFVGCYENSIVATCAPRRHQLLNRVWKEIETLWPRFQRHFPAATYMASGEIRMKDGPSREWIALADVAGVRAGQISTTRVRGMHAEYMLIITEETTDVAPAHMEAFKNTCTGPHNIQVAVGNPDAAGDQLAEFCRRPDVTHIRASCLDHPNVALDDSGFISGACTREWVDQRWVEWHEQMPHMFDAHVRGEFPSVAIGAVYDYNPEKHTGPWDKKAVKRLIASGEVNVVVGIDTGTWRFAQLICVVDTAERIHVVKELWSSQETTDTRMKALVEALDDLGVDPMKVRIWHDPGGGVDMKDINAALKRCGWSGKSVMKGDKSSVRGADNQRVRYRQASYQRIADLMARGQLLFAPDLGEGLEWHMGAAAKQKGTKKIGSRMIWEVQNLRFEDPKEGKTQRDDPNEATADGADMIAALRFVAMTVKPRHRPLTDQEIADLNRREIELSEGLARPAPIGTDNLPNDRTANHDYGLERITALREREIDAFVPMAARIRRRKKRKQRAAERRQKEMERRDRAERLDREAAERKKKEAAQEAMGKLAEAVRDGVLTEEEAARRLLGLDPEES